MEEARSIEGLAEELINIAREEILTDFKKEQDEPEYKAQAEYHNCEARAEALLEPAIVRMKKVCALAIAYHRGEKKEHNEDHSKEIAILENQLSTEDIQKAMGWWRG